MQFLQEVFHIKSNHFLRFPELTDLPSAFGTKDWVVISLRESCFRFLIDSHNSQRKGVHLSSIFRKCLAWSFNSCHGLHPSINEKLGLDGLDIYTVCLSVSVDMAAARSCKSPGRVSSWDIKYLRQMSIEGVGTRNSLGELLFLMLHCNSCWHVERRARASTPNACCSMKKSP